MGEDRDRFTCKTIEVMNSRHKEIYPQQRLENTRRQRAGILNDILRNGAHWERTNPSSASIFMSTMNTDIGDNTKAQIKRMVAFDAEQVVEQLVVGQRVVHDSTLGLSYVAAVRTPSSTKKTQKRQ